MYSLREGQGRRRTLDLILSIPPSHHPSKKDDEDTFSARERDRERRRQAKHFGVPQSEFGGGHSNNDSIHSFTPIHLPTTVPTLFLYILPLSTSTHTVYFPRQTNHAPSLAHNHSTFMEMCVIAVRYTTRWTWKDTTNKRTGFGVGSSILHTTIDSLYNKCLCEARRHRLCLTTSTIMYYTHLIR